VPRYRPDLDRIPSYEPGKPITVVARELGLDDIAPLASNESPVPPFPEVQRVIAAAAPHLNRYPETSAHDLAVALGERLGTTPGGVWVGPGSTALLVSIALATLHPGASAVYADPSFVMYPYAVHLAGAAALPVPLDAHYRHDVGGMIGAVREDTNLVFVCNPNNPTGTHVPAAAVEQLVDAVPENVTIVVDEAYAEYVTAGDYGSALPLALERPNVVVTRTFSKVYGLAALRVGYAVGAPATLRTLRRTQVPFATTMLAQVAAQEALRHPDRVAAAVSANAAGRDRLHRELLSRGMHPIASQANFVLFRPPGDATDLGDALLAGGVIVRPMGPWIRVTVGSDEEIRRFLAALDDATGGAP
jgi:histidinol-phosphate aminotransferase